MVDRSPLRPTRVIAVPGDTAAEISDADDWVNAATLRRMLGGVSSMAVWRWQRDRGLPAPVARVGGRKFWRRADVEAFKAKLIAETKAQAQRMPPQRQQHKARPAERATTE